ncbi:MAG: PilZ domain-containing protein [Thermodesulfobacteriota bacterium]
MVNKNTGPFSEKRRAKRISAPVGTTALLRNCGNPQDKIYVRDISLNGMLVYDYNSSETYPVNSSISNIFVDIPACELSANRRICLLIDRGKVVRSFYDQAAEAVCYGIELTYVDSYVKKMIGGLQNNI